MTKLPRTLASPENLSPVELEALRAAVEHEEDLKAKFAEASHYRALIFRLVLDRRGLIDDAKAWSVDLGDGKLKPKEGNRNAGLG